VIGPDGQTQDVELTPAGPGHYRGSIGATQSGAYVVEVTQAGPPTLSGETGWVAPYPAEFRQVGIDQTFLQQVAAAGGGRVLDDARQATRPPDHPTAARWPAWPLLVILAGLTWPLEIASRRFTPPSPNLILQRAWLRPRPAATQAAAEDSNNATADRLLDRLRSRRRQTPSDSG
jgi:hypothetical protein